MATRRHFTQEYKDQAVSLALSPGCRVGDVKSAPEQGKYGVLRPVFHLIEEHLPGEQI